jgi:hypothetical protein
MVQLEYGKDTNLQAMSSKVETGKDTRITTKTINFIQS